VSVRVRIERLVLDGVAAPPGPPAAIGAYLRAELGRLLARGGVSGELRSGGALAAVRGGSVDLSHAVTAEGLGRQVAHAIYRGIGR